MAMRIAELVRTLIANGTFMLLVSAATGAATVGAQISRAVVFSHYAKESSNPELVRRLLSPATAARLQREQARTGRAMVGQPVNLADERFAVYVPSRTPARGFALLVFVPPWQDARVPTGWAAVLDSYGVIFVSAARSGNDESTLGRREPLALLAAQNVIAEYPVDREHVYVGGFSGGSRVALRLALAYPDIFRGAILNAGSDPIGNASAEPPVPLPPRDLFLQFQSNTHVIYITGERDAAQVNDDLTSLRSMHQWCVYNVETIVEPFVGHAVAGAAPLSRALGSLLGGVRSDPVKLAACRSAIDLELEAKLRKAESLIASGRHDDAVKLLDGIDRRYGGLAAPRSVELAQK